MMRYRIKLILILLGMVVLLQTSSYIATRTVILDTVIDDAYRELDRGGRLFSQLMNTRARQLAQSVNVLTDDFGFKQAVASRESATIRSALLNHAARVNADLAFVLGLDGSIAASSGELNLESDQALSQITTARTGNGTLYAPLVIDGVLYQVVFSPINAPVRIGTAAIGFEVDQALSEELKNLTDLDVSFLQQNEKGSEYLSGTLESDARIKLSESKALLAAGPNDVWRDGEVLYNRVAIATQPQTLIAVLQAPLARALQPFSVLDTQLLTLALSFLLIAGFIALVLARNVTEPVKRLAEIARTIAQGKYNSPIEAKGNDEFSELAQAFTSMQHAISERERKIVFQAQHDSLTGLENRSQVISLLEQAVASTRQSDKVAVVAVVDIYKFTQINDTLGSEIGDKVLQEMATRLRLFVGADGRAVRLGSDEFLLIIMVATAAEGIEIMVQLRNDSSRPLHISTSEIRAELNVGYAIYPADGASPELLMRRANLALNYARQSHTGASRYHPGWDEDHLRRLQLLTDFRPALSGGDILLHIQPKISAHAAQPLGGEALVRWVHPQLGFVNPEEFISVIESAGQINLLTRWVIEQAVVMLARLNKAHPGFKLSINLSVLDLLDDELCEFVDQKLQQFEQSSSGLCFEVTEGAIMREAEKSVKNLERLHALGVELSIDDYGTGYSSLSQLKKLPVSELKIDKSFVLSLEHNIDDQQIVKSTIELGHSLGLSVTAEGVESEASRDWLLDHGCDTLQGYFYSKALPLEKFEQWLTTYRQQEQLNNET
ncbi:putative bifunctional diguanylate cyclase/phosphodiesterase [Gilvimarinus agarilyticus]|uniref:putative bifunctional diguanylate cyclase/phosphodiesterase n=1 Tax=Gilvimarinus agarilyticus TaxID=679259 RepID=UPI0005A2270D|nr:EAL domain-containing protein [Gilvimarinus agarilyticus]